VIPEEQQKGPVITKVLRRFTELIAFFSSSAPRRASIAGVDRDRSERHDELRASEKDDAR